MPTALVTGASRGIGLEFVRQYAAAGWTVHAGARHPGSAGLLRDLASSGDIHIHPLDVTERGQIAALADHLDGQPIDLLINNAGMWVGENEWFGRVCDDDWMAEFRVHVFGTMAMCETFAGNIAASDKKLVVNISSGNGSLGWDVNVGDYPYNTSKAALNMVTRSMAIDLKARGIVVVAFSPGFVATDMSGPHADLQPAESVGAMRDQIASLTPDDSGTFRRYNGAPIPW
jgi:NAD(P)-dependent dehydrogenase (short-subunit alcohol dehydrogenase family)